ncbi:MAG TPA: DNA topoisomerase IV subunit A, partial [Stellaceae bacterium]|nr:DNA topoisomerase IV subunit A [Stellaceae bacterium]
MSDTTLAGEIRDVDFADALGERYLSYALSTIMARSLPDVRDGLKPVHRRILHAMNQLRMNPDGGYKKCAQVVGEVMGKYHPHGDAAIYDAMVRLAQDFAQRYPVVDGQGNFGNVDGDNPAAMRYTESRMSAVAQALLEGIDEDAVDFRETYDGENSEPVVLPARFPNLLANGAAGIAVGMATSVPPHNVGEICAALTHLIDNPRCQVVELVALMPGPDFPTGGILIEPAASIGTAYETGRGSFRLRARWVKEPQGHGLYQIVVTEVPYQVQKSRLIEKIAQLLEERKLPLLADVRDESAEDIRLVFEPKTRNVDADVLMEQLFRLTELEVRVPLNLNVLDPAGVPRVMNLKEVLQAFLDHRRVVLQRRSRHRLAAVARRMEVLRGLVIVYVNLDEVIRIIREADEPKDEMMARWGLTDAQAEAILNMRLRALRRLEEVAIRKELEELAAESDEIEQLLGSDRRQWTVLKKEVAATAKEFGSDTKLGRRRTTIGDAPAPLDIPITALIEREAVTVLCSEKDWIRTAKGHNIAAAEQRYKEGDGPRFAVPAETTDRLMIFASNGRFYTLGVDRLPSGRGQGEPLRLMIDLPNEFEIVAMFPHRPDMKILVAASDGRGFVVDGDEALAQTRAGKQVMSPAAGARALICVPADGDMAAFVGDNRRLLVVDLADIPEMARGRGVILQRYRIGGL